jgi:hypothetical protein
MTIKIAPLLELLDNLRQLRLEPQMGVCVPITIGHFSCFVNKRKTTAILGAMVFLVRMIPTVPPLVNTLDKRKYDKMQKKACMFVCSVLIYKQVEEMQSENTHFPLSKQ